MNQEMWTEEKCCKTAIEIQNTSNSSGLIHTLSHIASSLWAIDRARPENERKGTDWINQHPAIIMFLDKLCSLARYHYDFDEFCRANDYCEEKCKDE